MVGSVPHTLPAPSWANRYFFSFFAFFSPFGQLVPDSEASKASLTLDSASQPQGVSPPLPAGRPSLTRLCRVAPPSPPRQSLAASPSVYFLHLFMCLLVCLPRGCPASHTREHKLLLICASSCSLCPYSLGHSLGHSRCSVHFLSNKYCRMNICSCCCYCF